MFLDFFRFVKLNFYKKAVTPSPSPKGRGLDGVFGEI